MKGTLVNEDNEYTFDKFETVGGVTKFYGLREVYKPTTPMNQNPNTNSKFEQIMENSKRIPSMIEDKICRDYCTPSPTNKEEGQTECPKCKRRSDFVDMSDCPFCIPNYIPLTLTKMIENRESTPSPKDWGETIEGKIEAILGSVEVGIVELINQERTNAQKELAKEIENIVMLTEENKLPEIWKLLTSKHLLD